MIIYKICFHPKTPFLRWGPPGGREKNPPGGAMGGVGRGNPGPFYENPIYPPPNCRPPPFFPPPQNPKGTPASAFPFTRAPGGKPPGGFRRGNFWVTQNAPPEHHPRIIGAPGRAF